MCRHHQHQQTLIVIVVACVVAAIASREPGPEPDEARRAMLRVASQCLTTSLAALRGRTP